MRRKLKILLSAYACEPNKGSEPGIGWNWAIETAKMGHDVWVITRENNNKNILKESAILSTLPNLHFFYYDLPNWLKKCKKINFGVYFYYFLWQLGILKFAKKYDKKINFDLVHHITFGNIHQPSFLYKLNKPFIFGPVAGGEKTPNNLLKSTKLKYKLKEYFRVLYNHFTKVDFFLKKVFKKSDLIICTSNDTKRIVPKKYKNKTFVQLAIGNHFTSVNKIEKKNEIEFKILYVGRFLYWKGIHLAMESFNKMTIKKEKKFKLILIGKGNYKSELKKIQNNLSINNIEWIDWIDQKELFKKYQEVDCLLFPSFHDSGGMVVLEAMSFGTPVICLDLGGPGQIVNNSCGRVIKTKNKTEQQVINDLTKALEELYTNPVLVKQLSLNAIKRAKEFEWSKIVKETYNEIEHKIFNNELKKDD